MDLIAEPIKRVGSFTRTRPPAKYLSKDAIASLKGMAQQSVEVTFSKRVGRLRGLATLARRANGSTPWRWNSDHFASGRRCRRSHPVGTQLWRRRMDQCAAISAAEGQGDSRTGRQSLRLAAFHYENKSATFFADINFANVVYRGPGITPEGASAKGIDEAVAAPAPKISVDTFRYPLTAQCARPERSR